MIVILLLLASGILAGKLLIRRVVIVRRAQQLLNLSIYLLLFLLGVSVGNNRMVNQHWSDLGLHALVITAASIAGSILVTTLLYRLLFRKKEQDASTDKPVAQP